MSKNPAHVDLTRFDDSWPFTGTVTLGFPFNRIEPCWNCGYAIGAHQLLKPCPTEIEALMNWGLM